LTSARSHERSLPRVRLSGDMNAAADRFDHPRETIHPTADRIECPPGEIHPIPPWIQCPANEIHPIHGSDSLSSRRDSSHPRSDSVSCRRDSSHPWIGFAVLQARFIRSMDRIHCPADETRATNRCMFPIADRIHAIARRINPMPMGESAARAARECHCGQGAHVPPRQEFTAASTDILHGRRAGLRLAENYAPWRHA
jgi:hypothetical protein